MKTFQRHLRMRYIWWATRYAGFRGDPVARLLTRGPQEDPYPIYENIRARGVVSRSVLGPVYVSASHEFVSQALRSPDLKVFDSPPLPVPLVRPVEDSFLMRNRPDHPRLRRLVTPWFTAKALQQRHPDLVKIAHQCLDDLDGRESFDLVQDYAVPMAVRVICEVTGLPVGDWRRLAALGEILPLSTNRIMLPGQERRLVAGWRDVNAYLDEAIEGARRRGTAPEGSLVAALTERSTSPDQLSRLDLTATIGVLLIAGFETSVGLMANLGSRLIDDPGLREAALADREVLGAATEETLRLEPPVQFTARRVDEDCEVAGQELKGGSELMLLLGAASRDPQVFPDPATFRADRANSKAHLAFSGGEHYCIGAGLARLETEAAVQTLFERRPGLRRAGRPDWQPNQNIRALRTVPVRSRQP